MSPYAWAHGIQPPEAVVDHARLIETLSLSHRGAGTGSGLPQSLPVDYFPDFLLLPDVSSSSGVLQPPPRALYRFMMARNSSLTALL